MQTKLRSKKEMYALTDQIRRSSRSVGANIAEAWSKRRYPVHFTIKLIDADAELQETLHGSMRAKALDELERDADRANANLSGPTIGFVVSTIVFLAYPLAQRISDLPPWRGARARERPSQVSVVNSSASLRVADTTSSGLGGSKAFPCKEVGRPA